jgi:hypothetical protein
MENSMRFCAALLLCAMSLPAFATDMNDPSEKARLYAEKTVKPWMADPAIILAILAQNAETAALTAPDIDALDKTWRGELGQSAQPTINSVLASGASDLLRSHVESSAGIITEIFVMDAVGLNVAASSITSDYWQGDEAKFTETFPKGADAMHLSDVEFDESTQVYQLQVSFTVTDPASGAAIGAVTVALDAAQL